MLLTALGQEQPAILDSLIVVSWNVHVGGGDVIELVTQLRSGRWTNGVPVDDFVVLLQEVHRAGAAVPEWEAGFSTPGRIAAAPEGAERVDVVETAQRLGLHLFYAPSMRNGRQGDPREDRGNAILSTLPLEDPTIVELPFEGQRRAAVVATIRGRSQRQQVWSLRLCSAHLDARSHGLRVFASLGAGRIRQARHLVEHLSAGATVLAGDFNTWTSGPREPAISIVREAFPQPKRLTEGGTLARRVLYDPRIDYMFFRLAAQDSVGYRRIDGRFGSDHRPLLATVPVLHLPP